MTTFPRASVAAFAAGAVMAWGARRAPLPLPDQHPSLAGTWTLNTEKSEKYDARANNDLDKDNPTGATGSTGQSNRRAATSGGSRRRSSGGGSDAGFGNEGGGGLDPRVARALREAQQQPRTLLIAQTDSSVSISASGRLVELLTNGRLVADSTMTGEIVSSMKAAWKKDQLVVERQLTGGTTIRSTYYLDKANPKVLIVDVRFESKALMRTIDNRRVYNAADGS